MFRPHVLQLSEPNRAEWESNWFSSLVGLPWIRFDGSSARSPPRAREFALEVICDFTEDSKLVLTPDLLSPSSTRNEGIIGEAAEMTLGHPGEVRPSAFLPGQG